MPDANEGRVATEARADAVERVLGAVRRTALDAIVLGADQEGAEAAAAAVLLLAAGEETAAGSPVTPISRRPDWNEIDDAELAEIVFEWALDLRFAVADAGHREDASDGGAVVSGGGTSQLGRNSGEQRLASLSDLGIHPRFTWQYEPPPVSQLVVRLGWIDETSRARAAETTVLVTLDGTGGWVHFADDGEDLVARIPCAESNDSTSRRLRLRVVRGAATRDE